MWVWVSGRVVAVPSAVYWFRLVLWGWVSCKLPASACTGLSGNWKRCGLSPVEQLSTVDFGCQELEREKDQLATTRSQIGQSQAPSLALHSTV